MAEASSDAADVAGGAGGDVPQHVSASTQRDLEAMEGRLEAIAGLRSGAGLLVRDLQRLLLSAENTAFDPHARSQECDMSLPLSRYWINSSHNRLSGGCIAVVGDQLVPDRQSADEHVVGRHVPTHPADGLPLHRARLLRRPRRRAGDLPQADVDDAHLPQGGAARDQGGGLQGDAVPCHPLTRDALRHRAAGQDRHLPARLFPAVRARRGARPDDTGAGHATGDERGGGGRVHGAALAGGAQVHGARQGQARRPVAGERGRGGGGAARLARRRADRVEMEGRGHEEAGRQGAGQREAGRGAEERDRVHAGRVEGVWGRRPQDRPLHPVRRPVLPAGGRAGGGRRRGRLLHARRRALDRARPARAALVDGREPGVLGGGLRGDAPAAAAAGAARARQAARRGRAAALRAVPRRARVDRVEPCRPLARAAPRAA
eukprot:1324549-Prymnesium_polylepis.1